MGLLTEAFRYSIGMTACSWPEDLAPITQRVLCQQPQMGDGVDDETVWTQFPDLVEHQADSVIKFHFRWMNETLLPVRVGFQRDDVEDGEAFERPAVTAGSRRQFPARFGQRDVEAALAQAKAFQKKLQGSVILPEPGVPSTR
jgi:hypothetical protein